MVERVAAAVHEQNRVLLVRPGAVRIDLYAYPIFGRLERVLEERIRADAVHRRAALRGQLEGLRVGTRVADGHCDLTARYSQGLHERPGRRFPQPIADLVVEGLDTVRLDDACVVAQAVEELRAIGLPIDRLQLDALDILVFLRSLFRRMDIETSSLP